MTSIESNDCHMSPRFRLLNITAYSKSLDWSQRQPAPNGANVTATHLVDHVGQQALDLIRIDQPPVAVHVDGGVKFSYGHARAAYRSFAFFCLVEASRDEDLAQQITQGNISAPLERQVDASSDKFVLAFLQSKVKGTQVAALDASSQWEEQLL